jgi:hypothetical protein
MCCERVECVLRVVCAPASVFEDMLEGRCVSCLIQSETTTATAADERRSSLEVPLSVLEG